MNIIYRADDGTEFPTRTLCEQYEQQWKTNQTLLKEIVCLDKQGRKVNAAATADLLGDTYYVRLLNQTQAEAFKQTMENAGYCFPNEFVAPGYYAYVDEDK